MTDFSLRRILVLFAAITTLSGCTTIEGARTGMRALAEKDGMIVFDQAPFNQGAQERIIYADMSERDEYALFRSPDTQAEFIYITTRHLHMTNLVVDRMFNLDGAMQGFRHNRMEKPVSGDAFKLKVHDIRYWARAYQLPEAGKSCGVFSGSWDAPADELRPSKALFGYFCVKGVKPLSQESIEQTMAKIGLRGITVNAENEINNVPPLSVQPSQTELLLRAQGGATDKQGNIEFPYKVVRYYKRDSDCIFDPDC